MGSGTPIQVTITGGFDYYYGEALRVAPIRDLVCDDFKAPLFLSRYSRICGCGYLFECSQVYTCYSPRLAPSVQFGAGVPADWEVDDFLANVQFTEGCDGTLAEPGTDPESYGARYATTVYPVTGIYRGRSVAITLKLIPGGYGTFVCPDC
ncbi:MAG: hypothetical protein IJV27_02080 [Prevotella sp.]|nr:hypothetical protein [Prevotella sp.]